MARVLARFLCCSAVLAMLVGCASAPPPPAARETALRHFFRVDAQLYRGGQPTDAGFRQLAAMGVRTVISLRAQGGEARAREQRLVEALGMDWVSLPMRMYWRPTPAQVRAFLVATQDAVRRPVFVHCEQGEDRTGSLVAVYRIVQQGWAPERAYDEAVRLGLADWNPFMRHLILHEALEYAAPAGPRRADLRR